MPEEQSDLLLGQIASEKDIHFLRKAAAEQGIPVEQLVKETIEKIIVTRTKPKTMTGTVQAFRRPYSPGQAKNDQGLNSE